MALECLNGMAVRNSSLSPKLSSAAKRPRGAPAPTKRRQQRQAQHPALQSRSKEAGEEDLRDDSDLESLANAGSGNGTAGLAGGSNRGNGGGAGTAAGALADSGDEGLQDDSDFEGLPGGLPHGEQLQGDPLLLSGKARRLPAPARSLQDDSDLEGLPDDIDLEGLLPGKQQQLLLLRPAPEHVPDHKPAVSARGRLPAAVKETMAGQAAAAEAAAGVKEEALASTDGSSDNDGRTLLQRKHSLQRRRKKGQLQAAAAAAAAAAGPSAEAARHGVAGNGRGAALSPAAAAAAAAAGAEASAVGFRIPKRPAAAAFNGHEEEEERQWQERQRQKQQVQQGSEPQAATRDVKWARKDSWDASPPAWQHRRAVPPPPTALPQQAPCQPQQRAPHSGRGRGWESGVEQWSALPGGTQPAAWAPYGHPLNAQDISRAAPAADWGALHREQPRGQLRLQEAPQRAAFLPLPPAAAALPAHTSRWSQQRSPSRAPGPDPDAPAAFDSHNLQLVQLSKEQCEAAAALDKALQGGPAYRQGSREERGPCTGVAHDPNRASAGPGLLHIATHHAARLECPVPCALRPAGSGAAASMLSGLVIRVKKTPLYLLREIDFLASGIIHLKASKPGLLPSLFGSWPLGGRGRRKHVLACCV